MSPGRDSRRRPALLPVNTGSQQPHPCSEKFGPGDNWRGLDT